MRVSLNVSMQIQLVVNLSKDEYLKAVAQIDAITVSDAGAQISTFHYVFLWMPIGISLGYVADKIGGTAALWTLGLVMYLAVASHFLHRGSRKRLSSYVANDPGIDEATITFNDNSITAQSTQVSTSIACSSVKKVEKSDDFFFVFVGRAQAVIIPLRIPESEEAFRYASSRLSHDAC